MAVTQFVTVSGQGAVVHLPSWQSKDATGLIPLVCFHGHDGTEHQLDAGGPWAPHPTFWADGGFAVGMVATGNSWLDSAGMTLGAAMLAYLTGTLGARTDVKPRGAGWSMGGGNLLRFILENLTTVGKAVVFSPVSDLDAAEQVAGWTAEIDALYGGSHAAYLTQGSPRSPLNNAASFRGGPKVLIVHPTDDSVIPYATSTAFVAAVNDSAVTLRQPDITGDHQGGLLNVPARETWEWLRT